MTPAQAARVALAAGASGFGLWFALRGVPARDVLDAARGAASPSALAAVPLAALAEYLLRTERWRRLLGRPFASRAALWPPVAAAFLLNNVLPFRAGEAARVFWTSRAAARPWGTCAVALVVDRVCDVAAVLALALISIPAAGAAVAPLLRRGPMGIAAVGALLLAAVAAARARPGAVKRVLRPVREALAVFRSSADTASVLLVTALVWGGNTLLVQGVADAFGLPLSFSEGAFFLSALAFGVALPSTPGYIGTYEAAGVAALTLLGKDKSAALSFVLVFHALQILGSALWGGPALWRLARSSVGDGSANVLKSGA